MTQLSDNLKKIKIQCSAFEKKYQRVLNSVTLLAVSKTKPVSSVLEAIEHGQYDFGENYLSDALDKIQSLQEFPCHWHFIGNIQSNKTRSIAEHFSWVHTLDREKIAQRLSQQRPSNLPPINCCIQINLDNESTKAGIAPEELMQFIEKIRYLENLLVRGIMVIPKSKDSFNDQRHSFRRAKKLLETAQKQFPQFDTLSMGMSGDIEAAIAEGATIVRVGTAIFGKR